MTAHFTPHEYAERPHATAGSETIDRPTAAQLDVPIDDPSDDDTSKCHDCGGHVDAQRDSTIRNPATELSTGHRLPDGSRQEFFRA